MSFPSLIRAVGYGGRLARGLLLAIVVSCTALAATAARAATYANFNRETYSQTGALSAAGEAARYEVVVLQANQAAMVPVLKAANPHLRVLFYEGIMAADNSAVATVTCTTGPWVAANHPDWILKDQHGHAIFYQNHYLLNVGKRAYQQVCLQNVIATAEQGHFDGVYWDMVNARIVWALPHGSVVPQYPTDASWQAATYSFLSYAGPQLRATHLMNVANIGGAASFPGLWQKWNGPLDGAEEESWTDGKLGLMQQLPAWSAKLANAAWSEAHHKLLMLHSWNTTEAGNRFGLASMLLIAGGESSYSTSNGCYTACETWYPEYATAQRLGAPLGPYRRIGGSVAIRFYQRGVVLVNGSQHSTDSVWLGGGTYTGSGLTRVRSVRLRPASAYILLGGGANQATLRIRRRTG